MILAPHERRDVLSAIDGVAPVVYINLVLEAVDALVAHLRTFLDYIPLDFILRTLVNALEARVRGVRWVVREWTRTMRAAFKRYSAPSIEAAFDHGWDGFDPVYLSDLVYNNEIAHECACGGDLHRRRCVAHACIMHCPDSDCHGVP